MTLQTAQARAEGMGQLYLDVTVTDAPYGNPRFLIGGVGFISTNVHGGAPVSPVVLSWGSFQGGASSSVSEEGGGSVLLDANSYMTQANGTVRLKVSDWLRSLQVREAEASLYQWNATESTQELVWKGYILGVTDSRFVGGVYAVELMLSATRRDMERTDLSDLVTKAAFSAAPISSLGSMVPRVYGKASSIISSTDVGGGLAKVGFAFQGVRGVVIDENQATAKIKVRFSKNDGVSSWGSFPTATSDDAGSYGGLWVYDSGMGCYGMVDNASYTVTNGVDYTEVVVDAAPKVFFYLRPKQIGSTNAAGFTDSNKIIDSDPNNFVTSDAVGNHSWAFYIPSVNFGGRVKTIGIIADWMNAHATKNRQISIGIWDIYNSVSANWLHGGLRLKTVTKVPGDPRIISMQDTAAFRYEQSNFLNHTGSDTNGEFASGTFVTRDTLDANQATLELRVFVEDLGGANSGRESVRLYNVGIVVEVDYIARTFPSSQGLKQFKEGSPEEAEAQRNWQRQFEEFKKVERRAHLERAVGTDWFARGTFQKDNGSGTYTGGAAAVIEEPQDIAHHILAAVAGQTVNATAGTLGNFVDPRTNGVLKDVKLMQPFGPDVVKRQGALEQLTSRFPMWLRRTKSGAWHCLPRDLNPHSSRVYRTTSEVIEIGPNDIELSSFSDRELDASDFINSIQLNYSHGYPDREASAQTTYENHLSQKWFGKKNTETYDYPELVQTDMSAATDAGPTAIAQWLGRRSARPLRIVTCSLFQKFYDLEAGHCLGFRDLENHGISVQAYRDGLLDYYFNASSGGTDYGDSSATVLISLTDSSCLIGLSRQTDHLTFSIGTAAAFTSVANAWRYSDVSGSFTNLAGIVNTNALKSTGVQEVSWTLPNWWDWVKQDRSIGGTTYGPCYWIQFAYSVPVTAGLANARTSYLPRWKGRYFEVLRAARRPGRNSKDYPYMDAVLMEVP